MKVLAALMTADHMPYLKRVQACRETWVPHTPPWVKLWEITGPKLGVPDSYEMTSFKTLALCRRALMTPDWEWLLRLDDDVCVHWGAVQPPPPGCMAMGAEVPVEPGFPYKYCAGAVSWYSRTVVEAIVAGMKTGHGVNEDREVGRVLHEAHIVPKFVNYPFVPRRKGVDEIDPWIMEQLKWGFVLEVGSPENMLKLHASLQLLEPTRKERSKIMTEPKKPERNDATFRDHQGRVQSRNGSSSGVPGQAIPRGPAVAKPQQDQAWFGLDPMNRRGTR